jgi:hypothetical protein
MIQNLKQSRWIPFVSLLISLFGILFLNWDFQHLIILFVWEIILMLSFAIIKMMFAQNELPFYKTLVEKLIYLVGGFFIGGFFILFSILFISNSIQTNSLFEQLRKINYQIYILTLGYVAGLCFNYFGNQKYKSASPMSQMVPFIHVLVILAFLQGFTRHFLPSFPNLNQAVWGIVALVVVKFFVDLLFSFFQNPYSNTTQSNFNNYSKF